MEGSPAGNWQTVHGRRRQRQLPPPALADGACVSEGNDHSEDSSAGSISHAGSAVRATDGAVGEDLLSSSLPSPAKHGLLASLSAEDVALSPRPRSQLGPPVSVGSASKAVPQPSAILLARQESLSANKLTELVGAGAGLRSSKSDLAGLTLPLRPGSGRQQRHVHDGSAMPPAGLSGITELASARGVPPLASARGAPPAGAAPSAAGVGGHSPAAQPGAAPSVAGGSPRPAAPHPFTSYFAAELHPGPSYPTADVVWGQTERDRVYNALVAVPYQLERFLLFGLAVCLDSFLAVFTLLPLRVALALLALGRSLLSSRHGGAASSGGGGDGGQVQRRCVLRGDQLFDLLGAGMSIGVVLFLWNLNAGTLYFWMKDLTQEFLKLSVLYTALELSDKICCSFGLDVLEALAASCTQVTAEWTPRAAAALASDVAVASLLLALHGATLMSQAMVFGVAMNSKKNTLVALLIAANFTEIKGTVLKRFDSTKLFALACQDVVERFHLLLILAFVVVEEMGNSGARTPNPVLLAGCARIYGGEVVIDIIKHAVLGKFNEIRPGVYREYMRDLCDRVASSQSHNIHKPVGFEPFGPAALAFRIAATAAALSAGDGLRGRPLAAAAAVAAALAAWVLLLGAKVGLGYLLRRGASAYVRHHDRAHARGRRLGGAAAAAAAAAAALQHAPPAKKDE